MLAGCHQRDREIRRALGGIATSSPSGALGGWEAFLDVVWPPLADDGVSWAGFYRTTPGGDALELAARRPKPACSPIGLHGACGQSLGSAECLVIEDVEALGSGYIACDPADRSELVIPVRGAGAAGAQGAVFDLDSHQPARFSEPDAQLVWGWLVAADLAEGARPTIRTIAPLQPGRS